MHTHSIVLNRQSFLFFLTIKKERTTESIYGATLPCSSRSIALYHSFPFLEIPMPVGIQ